MKIIWNRKFLFFLFAITLFGLFLGSETYFQSKNILESDSYSDNSNGNIIQNLLSSSTQSLLSSSSQNSTLNSTQNYQNQIILYFFYNPNCPICTEPHNIVLQFVANHSDIIYSQHQIFAGNSTEDQFAYQFFNSTTPPYPSVVFRENNCSYYIASDFITYQVLQSVYNQLKNNPNSCQGWINYNQFNMGLILVWGIISGLSPCLILITGVLGSSAFATKNKKTFFFTMFGFIVGTLIAYLLIGLLFTYFLNIALAVFAGLVIKFLIGIPLVLLGLWYILDAWNENSKLFKTPESLKTIFKKLSGKNSGLAAFVLGASFTVLKSPCVAGIMLSLLFKLSQFGPSTGLVFSGIFLFVLGIIIPIIVIFGILSLGVSSEKINNWRVKSRPYLRVLAGIIIIATTIYSVF